jgi:peroxiredoxin Q/BCP
MKVTKGRGAVPMLLVLGALLVSFAAGAKELAVGDAAPNILLQGSDGTVVTLAELLEKGGREGIILAWFPKAFTPG